MSRVEGETMRHAVINLDTHRVENVIVWDGATQWSPPAGTYVVRHDKCDIGQVYDHANQNFIWPKE